MKTWIILFTILPCFAYPLSFTQLNELTIPGVSQASINWGDYNNDGYLDLLITGHTGAEPIARVYKNNEGVSFTYQEEIELTGVNFGKGVWGDLTNNGFLDIIIAGRNVDNNPVTLLYRNEGNGLFTEIIGHNIPGIHFCSVNLIDFNNNGWLDIFISGEGSSGEISRIYQNNGDETFFWREDMVFPGFRHVDSVWGDINGNGFPDLIICGRTNDVRLTALYLNNDGNSFTLQQNSGLPNVDRGSVSLGDYDEDGWLDLLTTGIWEEGAARITRVYRNMADGDGSFILAANLSGIGYGVGEWVDLNNNGLKDIVICGATSGTTGGLIAKVYLNNGNGGFSEVPGLGLTGLSYSTISAADFNNNGKTDIAIAGMISSTNRQTILYLNDIDTGNTVPFPPDSLEALVTENQVVLLWNDGFDIETSTICLSYNIWLIPLHQADLQLFTPMADSVTGFRRVVRTGNAGFSNARQIADLLPGTYYWAVQTIDSVYAGSPFSEWQSFYVPPYYLPAPVNVTIVENASQLCLSWDTVYGADTYRIYGAEDPSAGSWALLDEVTSTIWAVPVNQPRMFFRITAVAE